MEKPNGRILPLTQFINYSEGEVDTFSIILFFSSNFLILFLNLFRTTKRPVPLEHCLFYSGELYKICENEKIIPQGLKAAKDVYYKKNHPATVNSAGSSVANERAKRRESSSHAKQNKHPASQNMGKSSGANWGTQMGTSNNWSSRRSEASIWLSLINNLSKKSLLPVSLISYMLYIFFWSPENNYFL